MATQRRPSAASIRWREEGLGVLFRSVDASSLGAFRILFGLLMLYEVYFYFEHDRITHFFVRPRFLFTYDLFPYVAPWPGRWLHVHFALMGLAAAGIALGCFYRWSALLFCVTYGYAFLLDKALYNNHFYLIVLLSFLLCLVQADRWASLDLVRRPRPSLVPLWNLWLLRAQIAVVFIFAGVAKLNPDWLAGEPMATWLAARAGIPVVGPWLSSPGAALLFSWAALLFDLAVPFLLLWRRTLPLAIAGLVVFNLLNHWLFDIGVFPFLVMASIVLFAPPEWPRRMAARLGVGEAAGPAAVEAQDGRHRGAVVAFLAIYLALQVALPLRHWLYAGDVAWTEEGYRFSWLMKLRTKSGQARFWVEAGGETREVPATEHLTREQLRRVVFTPDLMRQYARFLANESESRGAGAARVRVQTLVSLNRRPPQPIVDPEVDLAAAPSPSLTAADWIVPLDEKGRPGAISVDEYRALGRP